MRLIDADALKERAIRVSTVKEHCYFKAVGTREIDKAPTVDAVPVVHGRCEQSVEKNEWYGHIYTCKECEYLCMVDDGIGNEVAPNYCPNCGAKMDGV